MFDNIDRLNDSKEKSRGSQGGEDSTLTSLTILKIYHNETNEDLTTIDGTDAPIPDKNEVIAVGETTGTGVEQHGPSYVVVERTFGYYDANATDESEGLLTVVSLFVEPVQ